MIEEKRIKEDLLENKLLKECPYTLPDGYFSSLEDRLRERTFGHKPDGKWGSIFRSFRAAAALAASFLIVFGLGYGALKLTQNRLNKDGVIAATQQESTTAFENDAMLDSLAAKYGTLNLYALMSSVESHEIEFLNIDSDEELFIDAVQDYVLQTSDSYTSLLAEEFNN